MRLIGLAVLVLAAAAPTAYAQDSAATAPKAAPADQAVTTYPASYFAGQNADTAWDMVVRLPGFTFDGGDSVRGFAGAAGNVLIDGGRPTSKSDNLQDMLKRILASQVDHIDLIRGGAPGIDMHGKSVVANVVRKAGGGFKGSLVLVTTKQTDGRQIAQGRVTGSWKVGKTSFDVNLLVTPFVDGGADGGPHEIRDGAGTLRNRSEMHNRGGGVQQVGTASVETPLWGGTFKANVLLKDQPYVANFADNFPGTFVFSGPQNEHDNQDQTDGELGLHFNRDISKGLSLELLGLQHLSRVNIRSQFQNSTEADDFNLSDSGGESIARGVLHYTRSDTLSFEGGGEFAYNWVNTRTAFTQNGANLHIPAANVLVSEKRGEAFLTATWRPAPKLTVEAGGRFEASQIASSGDVVLSNSFSYPKPRLLVTWAPTEGDQVRVRLEREVGQLDFGNFVASSQLNSSGNTVQTGNPNLTPQQDWVGEVALEHHFGKGGAVVLTGRRLVYTDVIDRVADASGQFDAPGNIGGGTENDLLLGFTLPLSAIIPHGELKGTATWKLSRVTDPTTRQVRPISGQHPFEGELHFTQDFARRKFSWGMDLYAPVHERYYRFNEIDTYFSTVPYATLWVEYKARPNLGIRAMVDNASAQPQEISREVHGGPRSSFATDFTDLQIRRFGPIYYLRIRKTFG